MIDKQEIHIGLSCHEFMPDSLIAELVKNTKGTALKISAKKRPPSGPYAMLEWALPTAIVVYIVKPFFESYLQEAGKDAYAISKDWIKSVLAKGREMKTHTIVASQSTKKLSSNYSQSRTISIVVHLKNKASLTLLFDEQLDFEDWERAVDEILDWIVEHYEDPQEGTIPYDSLPPELQRKQHLYGILDKQTKNWNFFTENQMVRIEYEQRRKVE